MTAATMRNSVDAPASEAPDRPQGRLDTLLAERLAGHRHDVLIADRTTGLSLTYGDAQARIDRLAALLASFGLAASSNVGIVLPNGSDALVGLIACQRAGLMPCLMSPALSREELVGAVAATGAEAVITATAIGDMKPAEMLCEVAASFFGLRFLCAFGGEVPDGVIPLDPALAEAGTAAALPPGHSNLATLDRVGAQIVPIWRDSDALLAAALPLVLAARVAAKARLISLMAPDSLAGLATGPVAALASGATLNTHAVFDSEALLRDIIEGAPAHLVAPAWMEPLLRKAGLLTRLKSLILVHRPPASLMATPAAPVPVIDVVPLGETALLVGARDTKGLPNIRLGAPPAGAAPVTEIRIDRAGNIEVRGRAVAGTPLGPLAHSSTGEANAAGFIKTRFLAECAGPRITAVRESATPT
jgi:mycobactin salicyl-AMP ligase